MSTPKPWAELPAKVRNRVLGYWRVHADDMIRYAHCVAGVPAEKKVNLEDAAAYRAAIAVLRSAARPAKASTRKGRRR